MKNIFNKKNSWNFIRFSPIYLVIFSIQAPLSQLEIFGAFYDRYSIVPAIPIFLTVCLLVFAVFRLMLGNTQLAGLAALTVLMLLFPMVTIGVPVYPFVAAAGLGSLAFRIWKRKEKTVWEATQMPTNFTYIANVAAIAMVFAVSAHSIYSDYQVRNEADDLTAQVSTDLTSSSTVPRPLPNIVHIVLDGYSRADVLRTVYGFDNGAFLDALRQRGFRIASKATTPYNQTLLVMGSVFSLGAVNESVGTQIDDHEMSTVRQILAQVQRQGITTKILGNLGYVLESTPSTFLPLQWDKILGPNGDPAILNHFRLPETYIFSYDLLQSSPVLGHLVEYLFGDYFGIVGVNYNNLKDVPERRFQHPGKRPLFVYEHILAPHPPFNITADGRPRSLAGFPLSLKDGSHLINGSDANRDRYRAGYLEKLQYINGAILEQIDRIKKTLPGPLIIILHGDHGGGLHFDQDEEAKTCVHERFSPLLAVYATDPAVLSEFTDDFNLVNIYRAIFRALLKTDIPNLPDRSTFISWDLDKLSAVDPADLGIPCSASDRTSTAPRPSSSSARPPAASIAR